MKLGEIADVIGSNVRAARGATELAEREPSGYSIDSRSVQPGELFFAIRGENHDGHHFVADAMSKRAVAAVVARDFIDSEFAKDIDPQKFALLMVDDTLEALQALAASLLKAWQGQVVAITGSMGKTTTKELTAAMLARRGRVVKTSGNLNNAYGLPLSILQMESAGRHASDFDYAVLEMGMNHKGEIAELTAIAPPDVGVVTIVAPAHLEFFGSIDEIAEAKGEIVAGIVPGGVAVLNADDERVAGMAALRYDIFNVTFGIDREADVMAVDIQTHGFEGSRFTLVTPRGRIPARLPLAGRHNLYNALAAAAVADHYQVPLDEVAAALTETRPAKMRGEILRFRGGFTIIDDSYNSNPRALGEMVATLCASPEASRKIVVAGEMLELGKEGGRLHREAGREIARLGVDRLIGVRGLAKEIVAGAREAGVEGTFVETPEEAAGILIRDTRAGDLILVKGSRGVKTEIVVQRVRQELEMLPNSGGTQRDEPRGETLRQMA
jgi:UDP-N-acetylmuramoyl-tripeptide--D-alanyl-D-alanine ligase